jgi:hypothetical protein
VVHTDVDRRPIGRARSGDLDDHHLASAQALDALHHLTLGQPSGGSQSDPAMGSGRGVKVERGTNLDRETGDANHERLLTACWR